MVPVYSDLNKISIKHGYPKDLRTQGLISGIFSCVHSMAYEKIAYLNLIRKSDIKNFVLFQI